MAASARGPRLLAGSRERAGGRRAQLAAPRRAGSGARPGPPRAARALRRRPRRAARGRPGRPSGLLGALLPGSSCAAPRCRRASPRPRSARGPFDVSIVETGTLQALRSVTYASAIQSNQAKIVALVPGGEAGPEGRPADPLRLRPLRGGDPHAARRPGPGRGRPGEGAGRTTSSRPSRTRRSWRSARQKVERSELELKDVQEGKGQLKEEEAVAAVANAERDLQKAESALEDLRPLLAEGFITKQELERAEQQVAKAAGGPGPREAAARLAARLRPAAGALPGAARTPLLTKESLQQLESAAAYRARAEEGGDRRAPRAASRRPPASWRWRKQQLARTEVRADVPGDRRLPGRLLRLRAEEAPGGGPGLGQPAAPDPARHLEDGGGDQGPRDRHPQGREEPEGGTSASRPIPT